MKKIIAALLLTLSLQANAQWFPANPSCTLNGAVAQCTVWNNLNLPAYCTGKIDGHSLSRLVFTQWMDAWIMPGQTTTVFVASRSPLNPIIAVTHSLMCRF